MPDFATLQGLVERYSPSGNEGAVVAWLVDRMQSLGYTRAYSDAAGNALGLMGSGPRQAALLGHIDTVAGELPVRIDEGKLYGRGAVDAKAPLAAFVDAVARLGSIPGWQFVVIGAVGEERESDGARAIVANYRPDYAIIGEPNHWDRVALGYKGIAWADVVVRCEQFHTARLGESACELAVGVWLCVKSFAEEFNAGKEKVFDQLLLSLRGLDSGTDGLEQWARLSVGARLPVGLTPAAWYQQLSEIAAGAQVEPCGYAVPAWKCDKNTLLVRAFLSGIRAEGGNPTFVYKTGTADLNTVAPVWRCPALVYGPGDSSLDHTPRECIALDEYQASVEVLLHALRQLSQGK
jgi:LysW-gamma-L-lysine carboxypeptidase